ncbi:MAG: hypothetical protein KAS32_14405 [Candidatus Peribacteraceae bacterium]|nr:hypothetical protein [Candidatus Peribacteraceae bacterium]
MKYLFLAILLVSTSLFAQTAPSTQRPDSLVSNIITVTPGATLIISWHQYNQLANGDLIDWKYISFGIGVKDSKSSAFVTQNANFIPGSNTKIDIWAYPGKVEITVWSNRLDDSGNIVSSSDGAHPPASFILEIPDDGGKLVLEKRSFTVIVAPKEKDQ